MPARDSHSQIRDALEKAQRSLYAAEAMLETDGRPDEAQVIRATYSLISVVASSMARQIKEKQEVTG